MKYKREIQITLQCIICALIGLEISYKPNIYTNHLIVAMVIYIIIKYELDHKLMDIWGKYFGKK